MAEVVKVIDIARANNVSIMLTQFQAFKGGALEVRHALLTGIGLDLERLGLLLQVCPALQSACLVCLQGGQLKKDSASHHHTRALPCPPICCMPCVLRAVSLRKRAQVITM